MATHFEIVQVVGIVHNALDVAFVVANTHREGENEFHIVAFYFRGVLTEYSVSRAQRGSKAFRSTRVVDRSRGRTKQGGGAKRENGELWAKTPPLFFETRTFFRRTFRPGFIFARRSVQCGRGPCDDWCKPSIEGRCADPLVRRWFDGGRTNSGAAGVRGAFCRRHDGQRGAACMK